MKRGDWIPRRLGAPWLLLPVTLLLAGCALLGAHASAEQEHVWLLEPDAGPTAAPAAAGACPVLRVGAPRAAPGYGTSAMAYRQDPLRLEYFVHHRWADAPAQMLAPVLVGALERSGRFQAVLGVDVRASAGLLLETDDLRLEQLFAKSGSQVRLSARVSLVDLAHQRVLGTRELAVTEPAAAASPEAGVAAAHRALARFLDELGVFLKTSLEAVPDLCPDTP